MRKILGKDPDWSSLGHVHIPGPITRGVWWVQLASDGQLLGQMELSGSSVSMTTVDEKEQVP